MLPVDSTMGLRPPLLALVLKAIRGLFRYWPDNTLAPDFYATSWIDNRVDLNHRRVRTRAAARLYHLSYDYLSSYAVELLMF